jgi:hypothetical protein
MCCLQALHEAIPPSSLPPELGGSLQQANPLEWLQRQIEQQAEEQRAAAEARAKHAAGVAGVHSFTLAAADDEEEVYCSELGVAEAQAGSDDANSVVGNLSQTSRA